MSGNRGAAETKRMTSIVRKLHISWIGRKLSMYIGWDFFFFVVLCIGWLLDQEFTRLGSFEFNYERSFAHFPSVKKLAYVVKDETGKILMDIPVYHTLMVIGIFTGIVLIFQILDIGFSYVKEE